MRWQVGPSRIEGTATVPGDKSVAHRALMISAVADGTSSIAGLPRGADVAATLDCVRRLGVRIDVDGDAARIEGRPLAGAAALDARNSGTTIRLMSGLLAGYPVDVSFDGDASLRRRPMGRVVEPLRLMGASIEAREGKPPLHISGGRLTSIRYRPSVASAQVKSALLLAGMAADGESVVEEPVPTRNHTELMLAAAGVPVRRDGDLVLVAGPARPHSLTLSVPGDISSAAFLWAAAMMTGGRVTVEGVGVNPTRMGMLQVLERVGAEVRIAKGRSAGGEPVADVTVWGAPGVPLHIDEDEVPLLIDEIPLLALLATAAPGRSEIRGAAELRVKESDRIAGVARMLGAFGARITETDDGFIIEESILTGADVHAGGDHRMAMLGAVAGMAARGRTTVDGAEAAAVSFPEFSDIMRSMGGDIGDG